MADPISETLKQATATALPSGVPEVGDVIAEKYRVEEVLGMGGMGVVLAVRHMSLGELYAMKFLLPKVAGNGEAVARFMREAKAAVRIKSEHIARVSDVGQLPGGSPYIVMEYLQGTDLGKLTDGGGQDPVVAVDYLIQACAGLAEAHQLGIVHRDLKPSNLFLTRRSDGTPLVKVLDFGISKATTDSGLPAITATHEVFGSPAYMSPEQIRSVKNVDARSDVWALGVILFELITTKLPFEGDTSAGLLAAISADDPRSLRAFRADASEELDQIIQRCLRKKPADRFASVAELANALAPHGSADSQSLVQRISRLASTSNIPPPMPSGGRLGQGSGPVRTEELAATERSWSTQAGATSKQPVAIWVWALASVTLLALGAGGTAVFFKRTSVAAPDPTGVASTPRELAVVPPLQTGAPVVSAAQVASVSAPSAVSVSAASPSPTPSAVRSKPSQKPAIASQRIVVAPPAESSTPPSQTPPPPPSPPPASTSNDHATETSH